LERQRDSADWAARERVVRAAKRRAMVRNCMVVVFFFLGRFGEGWGLGWRFGSVEDV
jgi:hypothetical protein